MASRYDRRAQSDWRRRHCETLYRIHELLIQFCFDRSEDTQAFAVSADEVEAAIPSKLAGFAAGDTLYNVLVRKGVLVEEHGLVVVCQNPFPKLSPGPITAKETAHLVRAHRRLWPGMEATEKRDKKRAVVTPAEAARLAYPSLADDLADAQIATRAGVYLIERLDQIHLADRERLRDLVHEPIDD